MMEIRGFEGVPDHLIQKHDLSLRVTGKALVQALRDAGHKVRIAKRLSPLGNKFRKPRTVDGVELFMVFMRGDKCGVPNGRIMLEFGVPGRTKWFHEPEAGWDYAMLVREIARYVNEMKGEVEWRKSCSSQTTAGATSWPGC